MTDDLVKQLRGHADCYDVDAWASCDEAADRIEDLQRNRQHWQDAYVLKTKHEIEVRARNKELEAALDDMAQYVSRADWHYLKPETRAALGEKKDRNV